MSPERRALWVAKLKAFGAHFAISLVVFASVIAVLIELWYPNPYFWVDGGLFVLTVAAFVDIGLGPSITLVVFRPRWPRMRLIFSGIAAAQILALGAGVYLLYEHRPLFTAFIGHPRNDFFPVTKSMVKTDPATLEKLTSLSAERPPLLYLELPEDRGEANRMLMAGLTGQTTVFQRTDLYRPVKGEVLDKVLAAGRTPQRIELVFLENNMKRVLAYVAEHGGRYEDYAFVPLNGRYGRALLVFRRSDGRMLDAIEMKEKRKR